MTPDRLQELLPRELQNDANWLRSVIDQLPAAAAVYVGPRLVFLSISESYARIVGGRDVVGRPFREALPELAEQGYAELMEEAFATGQPLIRSGVRADWDDDGDGEIETHWVDLVYQPLEDRAGAVWGVVALVTDVSGRIRAERERDQALGELGEQYEEAQALNEELEATNEQLIEASREAEAAGQRLLFLSNASHVLASSLDFDQTLATVAQLAVERLADWCLVQIHDAEGAVRSRTVTHRDPDRVRWAEEIERRYPSDRDQDGGTWRVFRTGTAEMYPHITDELLAQGAVDAEHLELLRQAGMQAVIIAPIRTRERTVGTVTLIAGESGARYTPADLSLAEELGRRAGNAIENATLFRESELANERARRLQRFASALNEAISPSEVARVCVIHGIEALGANAGSLGLLDEQEQFRTTFTRGYPASIIDRYARFPLHPGRPLSDAVLSRSPVIVERIDEMETRYPEQAAAMRESGTGAYVAVPLVASGRTVGGLSFSFHEPQQFDEGVRTLLLTIGEQTAQALERARVFETEWRARARLEILADAGTALAASRDVRATLDALTRFLVPRVADWCFVEMPTDDGRIETVALRHSDEARVAEGWEVMRRYPVSPENSFGTAAVLRTAETEFLAEVTPEMLDLAAHDDEHRAVLRRMGFRSSISVPLVAAKQVRGVLSLVLADSDRRFSTEDVRFVEEIGRRAALALESAQLYTEMERSAALLRDSLEAEQTARREAEEANRAKSDFLGAMSHELRTPLNAIGGFVDLIDLGIRGPVTDQMHEDLTRVRRNQEHLLTLINDILNYTRLEAGALDYRSEPIPVSDLLEDLRTLAGPLLEPHDIRYHNDPAEPGLSALGDRDRIQQILLNLLGNAAKFSDPGDEITVSAAAADGELAIRVTDTGWGIPPERQESIFDPFVQLDRHRTSGSQQGVGLGLAISRQLARSMSGDLTVQSTPGEGSTFTLTLPRAR